MLKRWIHVLLQPRLLCVTPIPPSSTVPQPVDRRSSHHDQHVQQHLSTPDLLAVPAVVAHQRHADQSSDRGMLRSIGSTSMASTTMVPTSATPFHRVIHFPPPEIHRNQRVRPVTSGSTAQPEVDFEVVATEWFESLGSGARRLWQGIVQHSPVSAKLGRFAETRLLFSLEFKSRVGHLEHVCQLVQGISTVPAYRIDPVDRHL